MSDNSVSYDQMTCLALTPLSEELNLLLSSLHSKGLQSREAQVGRLKIHVFAEAHLIVAQGGHGKTQFGIQTQYLLNHLPQIKTVICAGCAGALHEKIKPFDVVVAEKTIEHDYQLKFVKRALPNFAGHVDLINKLKDADSQNFFTGFKVHFGTVASGDEDIMENTRARQLHQQTQALAVAWEGAGGARAAHFNKKAFIEVRGITDSANSSAPQDFARHLKEVMANVGQVLLLIAPFR